MLSELLIVLALVLANGLFSGAEIAVLSTRRTRLKELAEAGSGAAKAALGLRDNTERFLATVQVGITVVGAAAAAFGGASIAARLEGPLQRLGLSETLASEVAFAAVVAGVSFLSVVLGELVPKSLALRAGESYALAISRPMSALAWAMRPVVWVLTVASNLVLRLFGDRTSFSESRLSPEELQQLVEEAARGGTLDPRAGDIAARALAFADVPVADVMVPRTRVVSLRRHAPPDEVRRVLEEEGHSRMPVYEGTPDHIVGYVVAKDLLPMAFEHGLVLLEDAMRPALFVPETMRALDVLKTMQVRAQQLAIVVDEAGGMSGIVTAEDLVEQLVGQILTEGEAPETPWHAQPDGSFSVAGAARVRDLNRTLALQLSEEGDYSTLAGLFVAHKGALGQVGDTVALPDGTRLEVLEASPRAILRLRLWPPAHGRGDGGSGA